MTIEDLKWEEIFLLAKASDDGILTLELAILSIQRIKSFLQSNRN